MNIEFVSLIEKLMVIAITSVALFLGFAVWSSDKKAKLNVSFLLMTVCIVLWVNGAYLGYMVDEVNEALLYFRINFFGVSLFLGTFYYFFVICFLKTPERIPVWIVAGCTLLFGLLSLFTETVVREVVIGDKGTQLVYGSAYYPFLAFSTAIASMVLYHFFTNYRLLDKKRRHQSKYFFIGTISIIVLNAVFNIIFPLFIDISRFQYIGDYSVIIFLAFTGYAVFVEDLFRVRIFVGYLFIGFVGLLLLIDSVALGESGLGERVIKFIIFVFFLSFGYILIKSLHQDLDQKKKLENAHNKLEVAYEELQRLDLAKTEFLSLASHQLRTPTSAIRGYLSMILDGDLDSAPEKKQQFLLGALQNVDRLTLIISDLLNTTRIEAGRLSLSPKMVDIRDIIDSSVQDLKLIASDRKLQLIWDRSALADVPQIELDHSAMKQVFVNLIDNALYYTKKGKIEISLHKEKQGLVVSIEDTGIGISEADQANIFAKFYRANSARGIRPDGTGVGLFLAREITQLHGGSLYFISQEGKGTTFFVQIPFITKNLSYQTSSEEHATSEDLSAEELTKKAMAFVRQKQ